MNKWSKSYFSDLAERVASTVIQVLIPMVVAAQTTSLDYNLAAKVVGTAGLLALLKGLLANLGNPASGASVLPVSPGPEVND